MTSKTVKIALTALTCINLSLLPTVTKAQVRTGTWREGTSGPYNPGSPNAGYGVLYGFPGYSYYPSMEYYPNYYYRESRPTSGTAARAVSPAQPSRCHVALRRVVSPSGTTYIRRVQVCAQPRVR
jgi:hypothetical protein